MAYKYWKSLNCLSFHKPCFIRHTFSHGVFNEQCCSNTPNLEERLIIRCPKHIIMMLWHCINSMEWDLQKTSSKFFFSDLPGIWFSPHQFFSLSALYKIFQMWQIFNNNNDRRDKMTIFIRLFIQRSIPTTLILYPVKWIFH